MVEVLIDANSLIMAERQFYAFDIVPSFWNKLSSAIDGGKVAILDKDKKELEASGRDGNTNLTNWLKRQNGLVICKCKDEDIVAQYADIIKYVNGCEFYKSLSKKSWINDEVVAPWIIAAAKARGYRIVTFETPTVNMDPNAKYKIKIPDVANIFGVKTITLFDMMWGMEIIV